MLPPIVVAFLDVGQGDAVVISSPATREAVVVDCADARVVTEYLKSQQIKHLRGIIVTHLHLDHYRGVPLLLNNCRSITGGECEVLLVNNITVPSQKDKLLEDDDAHSESTPRVRENAFRNLFLWGKEHPESWSGATRGAHRLRSSAAIWNHVEILHPYHAHLVELESCSLNDTSAVIKVRGGRTSALLTGDIEAVGFKKLLSSGLDLTSDVLKVPHHGGWRDDPLTIFDAVKPSIAVISVGTEGTRYGHPSLATFARLRERSETSVLCTQGTRSCDQHGTASREALVQLHLPKDIPPRSSDGKPCAGSVVIELGDEARLLWPDRLVHKKLISTEYKEHKCIFGNL